MSMRKGILGRNTSPQPKNYFRAYLRKNRVLRYDDGTNGSERTVDAVPDRIGFLAGWLGKVEQPPRELAVI